MQESQSAYLAQLENAFRTEVEIYKRGDEVGKLELRNEEVDRHNREIEESLRQCRKDVEDVRAKLSSQSEEREEINAKLQILTSQEQASSALCLERKETVTALSEQEN